MENLILTACPGAAYQDHGQYAKAQGPPCYRSELLSQHRNVSLGQHSEPGARPRSRYSCRWELYQRTECKASAGALPL